MRNAVFTALFQCFFFYKKKRKKVFLINKFSFMQAVQTAANSGYSYYINGSVSIKKLPALTKKFHEKYATNQPRYQASRDRAKGLATFKFFAAISADPNRIEWILMFTHGKNHPVNEKIKLIGERKSRYLYIPFTLIKSPPKSNGRSSFTWKIEESYFRGYEIQIKDTVRSLNKGKIEHLAENLSKYLPGFSGIRKQKTQLNKLLKKEIGRHGKALESLQNLKIDNWTLRRISWEQVININAFAKNCEQYDRTPAEQMAIYKKNKRKRKSA